MNFVIYIRVSTKRQGESGLGLDAQQEAALLYVRSCGGRIIREFREVETGKIADRPELIKALAYCKRNKAKLVVAKLDRLARNMAFISALMDSDVEFVACDNPHANRLTLHILAAVAENEARAISERTKAALAQARQRGTLLGAENPQCRNLTDESRKRGCKNGGAAVAEKTAKTYADLVPVILGLRRTGTTLQKIADTLNNDGERTSTGARWTPPTLSRLIRRTAQSG